MDYIVRIHKENEVVEMKARAGTSLLNFLHESSIDVKAPCRGNGKCGKCRVRVSGLTEKPSDREKGLLGDKAMEKGYRLACYNKINSDIEVYLTEADEAAKIVTMGKERSVKLHPVVSKDFVELGTPSIHDQRSDIERVMAAAKRHKGENSIDLVREIPEVIRQENYKATLCYMDKKLISVEPGDTSGKLYGIAVDIGTTTIAAYLLDLLTGKKIDVYSILNPQKKYGADVVSRIDYTISSADGLDKMNDTIVSCINHIIEIFASRNGIQNSDIYAAVFVGNTTMVHFLMKVPAKNIAISPFIPATTLLHKIKSRELGIKINSNGYAVVFPCVSAYIGADTVAAVLSSGMYAKDKISLLIDIGTNGEIVLGNKKRLYSCSTAAGPAFEGANIRNGVGGISGAIDKVRMGSDLEYTTIDNKKAIGICGSGIVDVVAAMLEKGIIDETGRIIGQDEAGVGALASMPEGLKKRLVEIDGKNSFMLLKSEECDAETDIAITQKDIRELQNAKGAIAAGIRILVKNAGIKMNDIDRVYLAGGFGSYINVESALKIGLLPNELRGRIESIGNAAGTGAVEGLISSKMLGKADDIRMSINYVELSACSDFMDEYVECMLFE